MTRVGTLSEMLEEIVTEGEANGSAERAHEIRGELEGRLASVRGAVSARIGRPRVIALQSLDPVRVAGFWIPEMISIAGGEDVAGDPGLAPAEVRWGELESLGPELLIVIGRGSLEDAQAQAMEHWEQLAALGASSIFAVDAPCFAEAGPRLVDGVELLAHLLHPDLMDPPGNAAFSALHAPVSRPDRI